jgi:hypothetical protein
MFKLGNSVKVKQGVKDPDFPENNLNGWQGRIIEKDEDEEGDTIYCVAWDSITLAQMEDVYLVECVEEGLDFTSMFLKEDELELAKERDTEAQVEEKIQEIKDRLDNIAISAQEERIEQILETAISDKELDVLNAWWKYLRANIQLPFVAEVMEFQGKIKIGDHVKVTGFAGIDEELGIMMKARYKNENVNLPLYAIQANEGKNFEVTDDYTYWYLHK